MKVFSFCIYNPPNPLYYDGLLENISIIQKHYPGWGIYVYVGNDVPIEYVEKLTSFGLIIRYTNEVGSINMIYRFLAIEEQGVELMIVRDADSRVHWKDRWAINQFVDSPYLAHTIRDSPSHVIFMLGGLWGLKRSENIPVLMCFEHWKEEEKNLGVGKDQTFLNLYIWPRVRHSLLVHTSIDYNAGTDVIVKFPFKYTNDIYCGRVESTEYVEPPMTTSQPTRIFTSFLNKR